MEDDDVPDTRVFVTGLPLHYTSEQLGAHFAGRYQITDAVVIPGRKIGFVGFRNYTLAKNAVKYFDKTYIRMSKITVQIARPVDFNQGVDGPIDPKSATTTTDLAGLPSSRTHALLGSTGTSPKDSSSSYIPRPGATTSSKRKRVVEDGDNKDLNDYMEIMQPTSKPIWADGNPALEVKSLQLEEIKSEGTEKKRKQSKKLDTAAEQQEGLDNMKRTKKILKDGEGAVKQPLKDTNETLEKARNKKSKKKREQDAQPDTGTTEAKEANRKQREENKADTHMKADSSAKGGVDSLDDDAFGDEIHETDPAQPTNARSDNDWLRGKKSRLLDLVDPDEIVGLEPDISTTQVYNEVTSSNESDEYDDAPNNAPEEHVANTTPANNIRVPNGRLFVRNLAFSTDESDIESAFARYGKVVEVHISKDFRSTASKGVAYVQFMDSESAEQALRGLDGKPFQGRLLHILPAFDKNKTKLDDFELSKLPLKKQKAIRQRKDAPNSTFSWNSLYMNPDAVLSSIANRLGISKSEVLDPTSSDAAVKQAHAETHVIKETKTYLQANGINVDALKNKRRDDLTILLKNFTFETSSDELRGLLEPFGSLSKLILPPSGTLAIAHYDNALSARQALKHLAYRNFKGSVLFLEKGPQGLFDAHVADGGVESSAQMPTENSEQASPEVPERASATVFVRNLNFSTSSTRLTNVFKPLPGFLSATVKTRNDPKRPDEILSMGFGFVEFRTKAQAEAAISAMNGYKLDNHELLVKISSKVLDAAEEGRREDKAKKLGPNKTKIIIKNLPFEASKKDIRSLFGVYGQLRTVRVPKKFDQSTRGFAFADFVTAKEAENAMEALANTHLLGRRLVLEFAAGEAVNPEEEILALEHKVGQQTEMVHLNQVTGSARRKFNLEARDTDQ